MHYNQTRAVELLRKGSGQVDATFRSGQEEAIKTIVDGRSRLLVVEKTGWGKSFVYFIATRLMREQGAGPALLISPLLSLMRNQVEAAEKMGVVASTINSSNFNDWPREVEKIERNEVDILLISPERLESERFLADVLHKVISRLSLMVIDEAHCISDWGHDFRPHYRLIARHIKNMPANVRLLATTATANNRVMQDLVDVLGPNLSIQRGLLNRPSLALQSIPITNQARRLAWIHQRLLEIKGSGIIYALTKRDAKRVCNWLKNKGHNVSVYTADSDDRADLEQNLLNNEVKALVATVALGMGFDKPDLAFVFHFQMPGSVVAYYQQVGRAARGIDIGYGVLLSGEEDLEILRSFIDGAFPSEQDCEAVFELLLQHDEGLPKVKILAALNISSGKLNKLLTLVSLESPPPIVKDGSTWQLTTADLTEEFWARTRRLTALREKELAQMLTYVNLAHGKHMAFLIDALDGDAADVPVSSHPPLATSVNGEVEIEALKFLQRVFIPIEPRKQLPGGVTWAHYTGLKLSSKFRHQVGRALSYYGDGGWGRSVQNGKYEVGRFDDELVAACKAMIGEWDPSPKPTWVTCIPSNRHPDLVPDFARRLASALDLPFLAVLRAASDRPEQKKMENSAHKAGNLDGGFELTGAPRPSGPVFLVDDMVDSRWTLTIASWLLLVNDSGPVFPVVLSNYSKGA